MAGLTIGILVGMNRVVFAVNASLTATTSTIRPGDTITLNFKVAHQGSYGMTGTLEYDANQVTLMEEPTTALSGWLAERNGNDLVIYDNNQTNPLNGTETVITLKFKVNSNVTEGTKINISIKNIISSDGSADKDMGTATYSVTIARPLSGNANLASLSVAGFTLSPSFSAGTTSYSLGEVDYSVSKLEISYTTEDSNAKVSVSKNTLNVGGNTITITVIAENGATKVYTISVTRKQDPNYKKSNNADLSGISVSMGMLSPEFSASIGEYVVYLPYECVGKSFEATGTMADSKAQGVNGGKVDALVEGINKVTLVGVAEDGTEKTYTITVVVMPKYEGGEPEIIEPTPEDDVEGDINNGADNSEDEVQISVDKGNGGNVLRTVCLVAVFLILGAGVVYVLFFWGKHKFNK